MSCLVIIEAACVHCRNDHVAIFEQLDETFHCAYSAVIGFLTALEPQVVRYLCQKFFVVIFVWIIHS